MSQSEDGLPACDWIGAYDGVDGFQDFADVLRRAARLGVDLETVFVGGFVEAWLRVGCC